MTRRSLLHVADRVAGSVAGRVARMAGAVGMALALSACEKKGDHAAALTDAASPTPSASQSSTLPMPGSVPRSPQPLVPPPPPAGVMPRVLSVQGADAGIVAGEPLNSTSPLRLAGATTLVLRDAKTGLELKLEGPLHAYVAPGRISLVLGTFESLTAPAGAIEFWLATPYGTVRYTGRVRVQLEARKHLFEAKEGEAYLFRPLAKPEWELLDKPIVDHADLISEERIAKMCVDLDAKARELAAVVSGAPRVDPAKTGPQIHAKKLAQAACETARTRLLLSEDKKAPELYQKIEKLSPVL